MKTFTYDGVSCDSMGIRYLTSNITVLPPLSSVTQAVPGRPGAYFYRSDQGVRQITIDISLPAASMADLRSKARALAAWLQPSIPKSLVLPDEPGKTYYAVLDGSTDLTAVAALGSGTLTFTCPDPYAYGATVTPTIDVTEVNTVANQGTAEAFPVLTITAQADLEFIAYSNGDDYILLGTPAMADGSQTKVDTNPLVMDDTCSTITGWNVYNTVEYGTEDGTMESDGNHFKASSYGSGSGWHGPSVAKSLSNTIQDFQVDVWVFNTNTGAKKDMGRVEVYLRDSNGASIGKMSLTDSWNNDANMWGQVRAGADGTGHNIISEWGDVKGTWNDFYGILRIIRQGNKWTGHIAKYNSSTAKFYATRTTTWTDTGSSIMNPLATVQVAVAQYGTNTVTTLQIDRVQVRDLTTVSDSTTDIPYIAHAGDVIVVDHGAASVTLNGENAMNIVDPTSTFFSIPANEAVDIDFSPVDSSQMTVSMSYVERWL